LGTPPPLASLFRRPSLGQQERPAGVRHSVWISPHLTPES